jgi:hypothetical protein
MLRQTDFGTWEVRYRLPNGELFKCICFEYDRALELLAELEDRYED